MAITRFNNSNFTTGNKKFASFDTGYPSLMPAPTATDLATGTTASIAFTAQSGATSYTVISSPGSLTATGTSSPITATGLTTGTPYTFQIRANNSVGSGAYSAASNSITPTSPASFDSIATWSSGNNSSQAISFSSIPSTYKHLQLRCYFETTGEGVTPIMRFNGDSGSNYSWHLIRQYNSSTLDTYGAASQSYAIQTLPWGTYGTEASGFPNNVIIDIYDYTDTNKFKIVSATSYGAKFSASQQRVSYQSGAWRSGSVISTITFDAYNYTSLTRVALYGIKG
jgi:hypothetical protein